MPFSGKASERDAQIANKLDEQAGGRQVEDKQDSGGMYGPGYTEGEDNIDSQMADANQEIPTLKPVNPSNPEDIYSALVHLDQVVFNASGVLLNVSGSSMEEIIKLAPMTNRKVRITLV